MDARPRGRPAAVRGNNASRRRVGQHVIANRIADRTTNRAANRPVGRLDAAPTARPGRRPGDVSGATAGYGRTTPAVGGRSTSKTTRNHGGARQAPASAQDTEGGRQMIVLRREIGDVLRDARQRQGRTLREVSSAARVSLGYLSEVERGQKEASSELLGSICEALDIPMSLVLREVSDRVAVAEGLLIPDTIPADFATAVLGRQHPEWTTRREDLQPVG